MINIERQYYPNKFQHCPTLSSTNEGIFTAFYTGLGECHQSQHVQINYVDNTGTAAKSIDLEELTGNPIIFKSLNGHKIIYSKFENLTPNRITWWQYCSLWVRNLDVKWIKNEPKIVAGEKKQLIFEEPWSENKPPCGLGYLPRCNPIYTPDGFLLPLYREHDPEHYGIILHSTTGEIWTYRSNIGKGTRCIQPTLWYDKANNKTCALLRKFTKGGVPYAYYSESNDFGKTWAPLTYSKYYNANNSILFVDHDDPLVIWNNDSQGRDKISLGTFDKKEPYLIAQLDGYGSYPAACIHNKELHIAYTTKSNMLKTPGVKTVIRHKVYDLEAVIHAGRKDMTWPGFLSAYSS